MNMSFIVEDLIEHLKKNQDFISSIKRDITGIDMIKSNETIVINLNYPDEGYNPEDN